MDSERTFADAMPVAFVDIETTGGQAAWHRITEIAVVGARGDQLEFEWSTLVNPGVAIPPSIVQLTGIDDALVRDAPPFAEIAAELRERLAGRLFVAHSVRFDYGFIRSEFRRAGVRWQAPMACTARLSRSLFPQQRRHNLDTLIEVHGLQCDARHRALPDAQALWQFWRKLRAEFPLGELDEALRRVSQVAALPPQLPPELGDELPERPGVYRFHGSGDALIYVGKANNLRERVLSHFAGAHREGKSRRLAEQTQRIDWTCTAGELSALLLEAREVRTYRPVYNRRLRAAPVFGWAWTAGDVTPRLLRHGDADAQAADLFGMFRSDRAAQKALRELAQEQQLCLKLLGLERSEGSCFAYQLQRCRGGCVGIEPPPRHATRARLAMARWQVHPWPFAGAVAILERGSEGLVEAQVIDRWRHCGTLRLDGQDEAIDAEEFRERCRRLLRAADDAVFQADDYRILAAALRRLGPRTSLMHL